MLILKKYSLTDDKFAVVIYISSSIPSFSNPKNLTTCQSHSAAPVLSTNELLLGRNLNFITLDSQLFLVK